MACCARGLPLAVGTNARVKTHLEGAGRRDCRGVAFHVAPLLGLLGPDGPAKIEEVTLMRPFHGNL